MDRSKISPVDLFFYDGHHDFEYQKRAMPHFFEAMNDSWIYAIDDFMWPSSHDGTWAGLDSLYGKIRIEKQWKFIPEKGEHADFWNGVGIFVICKI